MALFHRRPAPTLTEVAAVPVPRFSIDGWTLEGTPLAAKLTKDDLRELETLLHGIAIRVDTPYTYDRAAQLLELAGEAGQALAVCEVWADLPAATAPEHAAQTRAIHKRGDRLRARRLVTPVVR
jgi:hypothetical protein